MTTCILLALTCTFPPALDTSPSPEEAAELPAVGAHHLWILTPTMLELSLVTTERPGGRPETWDFADKNAVPRLPEPGRFRVVSSGTRIGVKAVGFRRRVLYAPLKRRDLRIGNSLFLALERPVNEGAVVVVENPDSTLWRLPTRFEARADPTRLSPVLHVDQAGYVPAFPKTAMLGYYLGSLGELDLSACREFQLVEEGSGRIAFRRGLTARRDRGFPYAVAPYQRVLEADFSRFDTPGSYRLMVTGLGVSFPFVIDDGVAAARARTYALGLYHQRCGVANALPFTRFVHAPCHTAPAEVPTMAFRQVQRELTNESRNAKDNPRHTAPVLRDVASSLYPFIRTGRIDVTGGHHDAGDYSKYNINSARLVHDLVFAADVFPAVGDLDNLGLPESGDGRSDLLQIARGEADFLIKMQDSDGGFYFLVYPRDRAYETDVLPDHGDPQVVFPKTTAVTAAAVAALAQASSSPRFQKLFPSDAVRYLDAARRGWDFLERARAAYGPDGSYQKITHYGDTFLHDDELAWAATELYLATGERRFHERLLSEFDPADPRTRRWSWMRLFDAYGCAVRSYAFAAASGRVPADRLDRKHLEACRKEILLCGQEQADRAARCAYGTSFADETKRVRSAGWYFPAEAAFDLAVAEQLEPRSEFRAAIVSNLAYETGTNPVSICFLTGLGWKPPREVVHQHAQNDRRVLPPSGIPVGSIQGGFTYVEPYKRELGQLTFPADGDRDNPYPFYDRWGDSFNVTTEFVAAIQSRGLAVTAYLMAQTPLKDQPWRSAAATIQGVPRRLTPGQRFTVSLQVEGLDPAAKAQIVWESAGREPAFGTRRELTAGAEPHEWIEADAVWPDGRRVFAACEFEVEPAGPGPRGASRP
ncbi:MAG: glycoside hydrolase family 9 protein [Isosphaeraceae bacterium]